MSASQPHILYAGIHTSQHSVYPHELHSNGVKHMLKYMYVTLDNGIYFWWKTLNDNLPSKPPPTINRNFRDRLMDGRQEYSPLQPYGHVNSDWVACKLTQRYMTGDGVQVAGRTVRYKTNFQPTIADSTTAAVFMGASNFGKLLLFVRSMMWDIGVPRHAVSILYKDNDVYMSMAMAQKPML